MKTLKEFNLTFKAVKAACTSFNNSNLTTEKVKTVGIVGEMMLVNLVNLIDTLSAEDMEKVPLDVQEFYAALPEELFNQNVELNPVTQEDAAPEVVIPEGATAVNPDDEDDTHTSNCPVYGKGWSPKEPMCNTCNKDFHKDYVNCKRLVKGINAAKESKKRPAKDPNAPKPDRKPRTIRPAAFIKKSRYGHRPNTINACVDDMLWEGVKHEDGIARIMLWHARSKEAAQRAWGAHTRWMAGIITVEVSEDGFYKAKEEFTEGLNADNTTPAIPAVVL